MIIKRKKYFFKILWLFAKHTFANGSPQFLTWCFELAKNKNSSWYIDKDLLSYLVETAIEYDNEVQLCVLYNEFKLTFQKQNYSEKNILLMQKACKKLNKPETDSYESSRVNLININSDAGL